MRKSEKRTEFEVAFLGMRNEPDKDLVRERQVLKTTEIKQLRGWLIRSNRQQFLSGYGH